MNSKLAAASCLLSADEDGRIWCSDGKEVDSSTLPPDKFVRQEWVKTAGRVRVLGSAENAPLLTELHKRYGSKRQKILVGSPRIGKTSDQFSYDISSRLRMELLDSTPPSCGGWHTYTNADHRAYSLIAELIRTKGKFTPAARLLLRDHPAWPALSFIDGMSEAHSAELLTLIVDPRWHVDPRHPDRHSRLKLHLGLTQEAAKLYEQVRETGPGLVRPGRTNKHAVRSLTVLQAWAGGLSGEAPEGVNEQTTFLWRFVGTFGKQRSEGLLKATQLFVRYLSMVWLDNLTPPRMYKARAKSKARKLVACKTYSPTLFVPEHFFRGYDVEAWHRHLRNPVR